MSDENPIPAHRRRSTITVERVGREHADLVLDFFRREWGGSGETSEGWDPDVPQWVCVRDGEAIGYLGTIPARLSLRCNEVDAHWLKGFWVTEQYRSGPVGHLLLTKAAEELNMVGSQVVAEPAVRVLESQGFSRRTTLSNRLLILRGHIVFGRVDVSRVGLGRLPRWTQAMVSAAQAAGIMHPLGALVGAGVRAIGTLAGMRGRRLSVREGWDVSRSDLDRLWARSCDQFQTAAVRDAERLFSRYAYNDAYSLATIWRGEALRAWSVVRQPGATNDPRLTGIRVATLSDALLPLAEPAVGHAALRAAEVIARSWRADALICSSSHPGLEKIMSSRAYLRLPGTVQVMARDGQAHRFAGEGEPMWIMRGDARSDEAF